LHRLPPALRGARRRRSRQPPRLHPRRHGRGRLVGAPSPSLWRAVPSDGPWNLSGRLGVVALAARARPIFPKPSETSMINTVLTKISGSQPEREVKNLLPVVAAINEMEAQTKPLSDAELRAKTAEFKTQLDNGATLDDILIPAFAVAREAAWRAVHMRP